MTRERILGYRRQRRCRVRTVWLGDGKRGAGKVRIMSPGHMIEAIKWQEDHGDLDRLAAYLCDRCGAVHLGHLPEAVAAA